MTAVSGQDLRCRRWWVGILTLLILGTSCASSGPAIKIQPAESSLQVNDTVQVPVLVENIADLSAFEAHLSFDTSVLEVTELKDGGFVTADFIVQSVFDNAAGTIDYAVAQINRPPANGDGILFEVVFRAKTPGQSTIHFREIFAAPAGVILVDPDGIAIQVLLTEANVTVRGH